MIVFDTILIMLAAAVLLLALARRLKLPYPVLLAVAGAAVAIAQVDVGLHLKPELALALFIAPVLLDAAYDTSFRDLKRHWAPVASLVVIAVGLTTFAVALVVHALVPSIPWAVIAAHLSVGRRNRARRRQHQPGGNCARVTAISVRQHDCWSGARLGDGTSDKPHP
jgi:NhaP-type Na+/H+ or K+/H+ antiporter